MNTELRTAVFAHFQASLSTAFYDQIGGRLAYARARQDWVDDYAVFSFLESTNEDTFDAIIDGSSVHFNLFSKDLEAVEEATDACLNLFEGAELNPEGYGPIKLIRQFQTPAMPVDESENCYWQSSVGFSFMSQRIEGEI